MGWKFPKIPRPHSVVHLHYLEHFGASGHNISKVREPGLIFLPGKKINLSSRPYCTNVIYLLVNLVTVQ